MNAKSVHHLLLRKRKGNGMLLALLALTIISTLGISYLVTASSSVVVARRDVLRARALACAEAGVDRAISFLMSGNPGTYRTSHPSSIPDNHNGDAWYYETVRTGETFRICVRDGTGIHTGKVVITSQGMVTEAGKTVSRTVKVVVTINKENICVWNNVIFGGVGQAGRSINGNVVIRGSVHLLGDGEDYTDLDGDGRWSDAEPYSDINHNGKWDVGEPFIDADGDGHYDVREPFVDANGNGTYDPPLTVTDLAEELSGAANIGNNYSGMSTVISTRIPPLQKKPFGGEMVDTLNAKLRVKHGRVDISGSATIGDPNVTGNGIKETMDGLYVSDGYGGNKGAASAYGDNGTGNPYDLAEDAVDLPLIDSGQYTDQATGITYANYLEYLQANGTVVTGDLNIEKGTPLTISGPKGSLTIDASGNMTISGIVFVTGNINFGPSKVVIEYSGSGTLVTPKSTYFHCSILPKTQFPNPDALGIIAGDRVELATGGGDAHLDMALAMYAQHQVEIGKQCDIAGTVVSSYYSMKNVPKIYQVPALTDNLPPGMPGGDPIWIASVITHSWQDVKNP